MMNDEMQYKTNKVLPDNPAEVPMPPVKKPNFPALGVELRDWFAGLAMQAGFAEFVREGVESANIGSLCVSAYEVADAMLKARSK